MQLAGVKPNQATFISVAQAYANIGNLESAEKIMGMTVMDSHGLSVLLGACTNAQPYIPEQASKIFKHWVGQGIVVEEQTFKALGRAVGYPAARRLCEELQVRIPETSWRNNGSGVAGGRCHQNPASFSRHQSLPAHHMARRF